MSDAIGATVVLVAMLAALVGIVAFLTRTDGCQLAVVNERPVEVIRAACGNAEPPGGNG